MSSSIQYNPNPPRVWSRVQNSCSVIAYNNNDPAANSNFAKADYEKQMLLKGNILQYKKNSSNLTKKQRYTQIAKGMWTNRTKTWATQSDTYTNPNMTSLLRVNYTILDPSNNNFSNPQNPFGCPTTTIQDGGNLVCNRVVNPCTQEIIKKTVSQQLCNPTTDSDVPGQIQPLCWNDGTQTWYPRQRYIMPTSGTKWPQGYKGFTSALTFVGPVLSVGLIECGDLVIPLSWTFLDSTCAPITSFNIYQNGRVILNVPVSQTSVTITENTSGTYTYYVTSVSNTFESEKSNTIIVSTQYGYTSENANISNNGKTITFLQNGLISFFCDTNIQYTIVGGGGSGGYDSQLKSGLAAGGGGHVINSNPFVISVGSILYITIGLGGIAPKTASPNGIGKIGGDTTITGSYSASTNNLTYGGGGGFGFTGIAWQGGGGIGNNITSASGGIYTNYYSDNDNNGTGGAGGSINTTLGNQGGANSASAAGNGGVGQVGIDGNFYGGGGGGGVKLGGTGGLGGLGGGGRGANYNSKTSAEPGNSNTGGGGGAGYYVDITRPYPSADGGSGIAIIMIM